MDIKKVRASAQGQNDLHAPLPLRPSLLEKLVKVPRDHALSLYVRHPFIDRIFESPKLLGLRQQIIGRGLLQFLRQQLKSFDSFLDGRTHRINIAQP
ncbi:hypothetical protein [Bradyrhizobium sp. B117]|uniref:hypothetical protein n=1 Tax=Bradyrhizobium sp. B117 TaxID=3140246 RepID=UPI003183B94A